MKKIGFNIIRLLIRILMPLFYRVTIKKDQDSKELNSQAVVYACNHVSYVDAFFLALAIDRPVRFIMYYKIYNLPILNFIFKNLGAIPIAGYREDKEIFNNAFKEIELTLKRNGAIFIFPEGALTYDGKMVPFKKGIEKIIKTTPVPVIPIALNGLWGSIFSRHKNKLKTNHILRKIEVSVGKPIDPQVANIQTIQKKVHELL
ncbi:1-acyl-sn-glycerol-3-phosphate acyltransferase [Photobacterium kishitanii]|nr:1-acyl-sn-glycerol-3-phosphate acyltransferase [Photobacterium kishitanii]